LSTILPSFPAGAPGIVVVQHMPEGFTGPFAARLDSLCSLSVREARHGDVLEPGMVLVAPGGSRHMTVSRHGRNFRVSLIDGDPVCFSRPSVDVLFDSVARAAGAQAAGAILTGMGRDGANGLLNMRRAGAHTFAQDEQTSVVYGMPMAARDNGGAEHVLPLEDIPARMLHAAATIGAVRA
jgi:two-component system chemotaxis response regulator CheB